MSSSLDIHQQERICLNTKKNCFKGVGGMVSIVNRGRRHKNGVFGKCLAPHSFQHFLDKLLIVLKVLTRSGCESILIWICFSGS